MKNIHNTAVFDVNSMSAVKVLLSESIESNSFPSHIILTIKKKILNNIIGE